MRAHFGRSGCLAVAPSSVLASVFHGAFLFVFCHGVQHFAGQCLEGLLVRNGAVVQVRFQCVPNDLHNFHFEVLGGFAVAFAWFVLAALVLLAIVPRGGGGCSSPSLRGCRCVGNSHTCASEASHGHTCHPGACSCRSCCRRSLPSRCHGCFIIRISKVQTIAFIAIGGIPISVGIGFACIVPLCSLFISCCSGLLCLICQWHNRASIVKLLVQIVHIW